MTTQMLGERRTRALRDLSAHTSKAKSVSEALALSAQTLAEYDLDLPFVLLYALDPNGDQARLVGATGLRSNPVTSSSTVDLGEAEQAVWPLKEVVRSRSAVQVDDVRQRIDPASFGSYPETPNAALVVPIIPPGADRPAAIFIAAISPRLPMNEAYRSFYDLLASSLGTAVRPTARHRILVVDDNLDSAVSLAMLLTIMGHETRTAHDGLEALDVAAAFRPEVMLLDIGMPKLDGYEVCRRVRQQAWGKDMVVIVLSGWGQEEDKRRSLAAGFDAHLVKPVVPAALEELLAGMTAARA